MATVTEKVYLRRRYKSEQLLDGAFVVSELVDMINEFNSNHESKVLGTYVQVLPVANDHNETDIYIRGERLYI